MYLSKITLKQNRAAAQWAANPYRVHQRLMMACDHDPRLLFRIEERSAAQQILVQSHNLPDWQKAFAEVKILESAPLCKPFHPLIEPGGIYRFFLKANPTVKKTIQQENQPRKTRLGILSENAQLEWLRRKLEDAGADLVEATVVKQEFQHSHKTEGTLQHNQTHLSVVYEGLLRVKNPEQIVQALENGIGSAKGYGFGLLSLARPA